MHMGKHLRCHGVGVTVQAIQSDLVESLVNGAALLVGMTLAIDTPCRP
jgi:hypothetical protein